MTKVIVDHFRSFKFVYPENLDELLLYISALGGISVMTDIPDLILLENVDEFPASSLLDETIDLKEDKTTLWKGQSKLFSFLENLSATVSDHKPLDVLVSAAKMGNFSSIERNYLWLDEIWEVRVMAANNEDMDMVLVDKDSKLDLKLKFTFATSSNQYFFHSLSKEANFM
jgi:hypothetical protein